MMNNGRCCMAFDEVWPFRRLIEYWRHFYHLLPFSPIPTPPNQHARRQIPPNPQATMASPGLLAEVSRDPRKTT